MRPVILCLLALAAVTPTLAAAADTLILPGYWESRNKLSSVVTLSDKVERRCITPKDVEKFMSGPSNRHYRCNYPNRTFENGVVSMTGVCVDKSGRKINVRVTGTYTPTSVDMQARLNTKLAGIPLGGLASSEGRRIGDVCPPGSEIK